MLEQSILSFSLLGAEWVLWVLVLLSVGIIAISIERSFFLARDGSNLTAIKTSVDTFLKSGNTETLGAELRSLDGFEARFLTSGIEMANSGTEADIQFLNVNY